MIEIGPGGAKAIPPAASQSTPEVQLPELGQSVSVSESPAPNEYVAEIEQTIRNDIQKRFNHLNEKEKESLLIREYAVLMVQAHFQNIGHIIYGSQIAALRLLVNSPPVKSAGLGDTHLEHEKRCVAADASPSDFISWTGYLVNSRLITLNSEGLYTKTTMGQQFLEWAGRNNINEATRAL